MLMKKIPNYSIEREIGEGGMATVYLAVQDMLHRYVALKVMRPELTQDKNFRQSFLSEGSTIANLEHSNIIRIHDIGITDDTVFYMAMEYLSGGSLKERLDKGKLSYSHTLFILEEVANGLAYAHKKGYIHRDIKPANILFRDDGIAILSDFGLAKLQNSSGELTRMGFAKGTVQYMSPEQAITTDLDQRSDIYSLGLVFYEMLTGDKAFLADSTIQAIHQHTTIAPPNLPDQYAFLQAVLNKVLAKSPDKRYQNVSDFIKAIKTAIPPDEEPLPSNDEQSDPEDTTVFFPAPPTTEHIVANKTKAKNKKSLMLMFASLLILLGSAFGIYRYSSVKNITHINTPETIALAQTTTGINKEAISATKQSQNNAEQIKQQALLKQTALEDELAKQKTRFQEQRIKEEQKAKEAALEKQKALDEAQAKEQRKAREIEDAKQKTLAEERAKKEQKTKEVERIKQQQLAKQKALKRKKAKKERIRKNKIAKENARKNAIAEKQREEKKVAEKKAAEDKRKRNLVAKNQAQIKVSVTLEGRPLKTYIMVTKKGKRLQVAKGKSFAVFNLPLGQYTVSASYNGKKATAIAHLEEGDIIMQKFSFKKSTHKKDPPPPTATPSLNY